MSWEDESRTLEPKVMQVLVALYNAHGDTFSRDALIERCWNGRVAGENSINRVVWLLRALASEQGAFEFETITKTGYRLNASGGPI